METGSEMADFEAVMAKRCHLIKGRWCEEVCLIGFKYQLKCQFLAQSLAQ
jgi:hypothetical protein